MFLTSATTSPSPTRSARKGEGEGDFANFFFTFPVILAGSHYLFFLPIINLFIYYSTRIYTVPDDPGLFDGHVWPMYLKHRKLMEANGLNIGKIRILLSIFF